MRINTSTIRCKWVSKGAGGQNVTICCRAHGSGLQQLECGDKGAEVEGGKAALQTPADELIMKLLSK